MNSIRAIDIGVPGGTEHRAVSRRAPALITVRGGIRLIIGFHLDDDAADIVHQQGDADQIARDLNRIAAEELWRKQLRHRPSLRISSGSYKSRIGCVRMTTDSCRSRLSRVWR